VAAAIREAGGAADAVELDVRSADAFERVAAELFDRAGRIDYLFNNAGIAILGAAREMTLADWNALVDINLRGVIHGVAAAYPLMIRQGFGHIVNTASIAGLAPTPGAVGYATTKHAVVGLSISLREEADAFGVKVSVVCPGLIDTPIKHSAKLLNTDSETLFRSLPVKLYPAERCAEDILRGVARNRAIIPITGGASLVWRLYRLLPGLTTRLIRFGIMRSPVLGPRR
jgi:NAD(P)-dependent dehydrogenase (short-subunit alcohol dehydrogenase family)